MTKIVCISDTHEQHEKVVVPEGDILICAGDFTFLGKIPAVANFTNWFGSQPHKYKVCIAGNHDLSFESSYRHIVVNLMQESGIIYLENNSCEIDGLYFYGSPYTPRYFDWAFNIDRNSQAMIDNWNKVPQNTNILITHGPPYGILDSVQDHTRGPQGCEILKKKVKQLANLKAHIFGHLHHGYGSKIIGKTTFVNAAICTDAYTPTNKSIVIEL